ncbi:DUF3426 domain-containing protein [Paraburkholderia bonniea]|uniref:zinc-ribbon and DUF3426 domain-containing protein n=1 Tax=Paraburkholderia bonniea TaxID=2152891 RepID=UPI0012915640|nr:zinc-ribbon and DUF3426 domain-containing protein [Paraburkholderia bonniea]WJF89894.1 DUF3426 domain-containing protein [Paraburkholderia bonniea]WJF93208.1 DUF3426 domain-containing protein [Paraburkholderia bonniea]
MILATRCPFCETVFRLQPAQLALRQGLVRCGHCQEVFDASGSLFETTSSDHLDTATPVAAETVVELTSGPANPAAARPPAPDFTAAGWNPWTPATRASIAPSLRQNSAHIPPAKALIANITALPPGTPFRASPLYQANPHAKPATLAPALPVEPPREPGMPAAPFSGNTPEEPSQRSAPQPEYTGNTAHAGPNEPHLNLSAATPAPLPPLSDDEAHFAVTRETREGAPRRTGWKIVGTLLVLVLLAALVLQLAWWQRETVMVYWPHSQKLFNKACVQLGCSVSPPRDIDGLLIEPSDLRQVDGPHRLELRMPLRNRSDLTLAYPAAELTLLDEHNNIAMRRVLWPQDYVSPGTSVTTGLPPQTTQTMIVHLDTGTAIAVNFRVQIFYP